MWFGPGGAARTYPDSMIAAGRVVSLWRYPVKSMAGERLDRVQVGTLGLHADRTWAVRDRELGATTNAKRLPGLMWCSARFAAEPPPDAGPGKAPEVIITLPDGREFSSADPGVHTALSSCLDRDVELRPLPPIADRDAYRAPMATQSDLRTIFGLSASEPLPDLSMFPVRKLAEITRYATPLGSYADAYAVHLLTVQSLAAMTALAPESDFDVRRFRPSVLVDAPDSEAADDGGQPELRWCGGMLHAPAAVMAPLIPTVRCVMPSHSQPGLDRDPGVTRTIAAHSRRCLGVYATVVAPGRIAQGDLLRLDPPNRSAITATAGSAAESLKRAVMRAVSAALPRGNR